MAIRNGSVVIAFYLSADDLRNVVAGILHV